MIGVPFLRVVPASTFFDADGDPVVMTAKEETNGPLSAWFTAAFNAATGHLTLSGTPSVQDIGSRRFRVFARDSTAPDAAFVTMTITTAGEVWRRPLTPSRVSSHPPPFPVQGARSRHSTAADNASPLSPTPRTL
jgi:hypothetical protein